MQNFLYELVVSSKENETHGYHEIMGIFLDLVRAKSYENLYSHICGWIVQIVSDRVKVNEYEDDCVKICV